MEPNYHGYTESEEKKADRASRRNWDHSVASLGLPSITEAEVDEFLLLMEKTKRADHIAIADPRTDETLPGWNEIAEKHAPKPPRVVY